MTLRIKSKLLHLTYEPAVRAGERRQVVRTFIWKMAPGVWFEGRIRQAQGGDRTRALSLSFGRQRAEQHPGKKMQQ